LLATSWVICITLNLNEVVFSDLSDSKCTISSYQSYLVWLCVKTALISLILLVLLVLSILTLRRLSSPQAIEDNLSDAQRRLRRKRIGSAVKMVLYSVILYCCCLFPFLVFILHVLLPSLWPSILKERQNSCLDYESFGYLTLNLLPLLNCSLSPCVYFVCLADFRQAAKAVLCRGRNRNNSEPIQNTATNRVQATTVTTTL